MASTENLCTICSSSQTDFCSRCKSARYCSKQCQQADWPTHKLLCPTFKSFTSLPRPSKDHFIAILFPPEEKKPKFIWLECEWHDASDDMGERSQYPDRDSDEILGDAMLWQVPLQFNTALNRQLYKTIHFNAQDTFLIDGSKASRSILGITKGLGHDWRGPVFAYGKDGQGLDPRRCRDLDMMDFRHIVDYLLWYNSEAVVGKERYLGEKIKGVKINCLGDQKVNNLPPFEAVEVPATHPIFRDNDKSDISKRIGIPILTRQYPKDPKWIGEFFDNRAAANNQDATFLHLSCDPNAEFDPSTTGSLGWGFAPKKWQNNVGSVIVALSQYCRFEVGPLFQHSDGGYAPEEPMGKEVVLMGISRAMFIIMWYKFLEKKREEGKQEDVESPYEVK